MSTETITPEVVADVTPLPELQLIVQQQALPPETAANLFTAWAPHFKAARDIIEESRKIVVTDASDTRKMKLSGVNRLALKKLRVSADAFREKSKAESLRTGNAIQGFWHIFLAMVAGEEQRLKEQEDFVAIQEAKRQAALTEARSLVLTGLNIDPALYSLGAMDEAVFQQLVEGTKLARAAEAERVKKAEADRIAKDAADLAERERIRLENERLKREAEEREAAAEAKREHLEAEQRAEDLRKSALIISRKKHLLTLVATAAFDHISENMLGGLSETEFAAVVEDLKAKKAEREAAAEQLAQAKADHERIEKEQAAAKVEAERMLAEQNRIAAERHAKLMEENRIANEKAQQEREAIGARAVEERRQADAVLAEQRRKADETAAKIRSAADERARKAKVESDRRATILKEENDRVKAQLKAENEAQAKRAADAAEAARKAAAAPDKEKIVLLAKSLDVHVPEMVTPEGKVIRAQFMARQNDLIQWLREQYQTL